jgi:hypothetical protein
VRFPRAGTRHRVWGTRTDERSCCEPGWSGMADRLQRAALRQSRGARALRTDAPARRTARSRVAATRRDRVIVEACDFLTFEEQPPCRVVGDKSIRRLRHRLRREDAQAQREERDQNPEDDLLHDAYRSSPSCGICLTTVSFLARGRAGPGADRRAGVRRASAGPRYGKNEP